MQLVVQLVEPNVGGPPVICEAVIIDLGSDDPVDCIPLFDDVLGYAQYTVRDSFGYKFDNERAEEKEYKLTQ